MATAWTEQQKDPNTAKLGFDERLGVLVDAERLHRENICLDRCLREARPSLTSATSEDVDLAPRRELNKAVSRQLATCRWVHEHQNVAITGSTGTGNVVETFGLSGGSG